jgi:hypothetical protein
VIRSHKLPTPLVWIEHWPEESTDGGEETFELVVFSSYKVEERAPYLGEGRAWIGDATWKRLDRASVEVLVGGKVLEPDGALLEPPVVPVTRTPLFKSSWLLIRGLNR